MTPQDAGATARSMIRDAFRSSVRSVFVQQRLGDLAGLYLDAAMRSTRWRVDAVPLLAAIEAGTPCIIVFWHECLPSMPILWRQAGRTDGGRQGYVLASRHRDGQLIARTMRRFGIAAIAGSTSRGGPGGLRSLARLIGAGHPVGLTPDGPRGPRRRAAPGVAQLAALTGAPVFCAAAATSRAVTLDSWDRMRIPLPFGRGALVAQGPVLVARDGVAAGHGEIEALLTGSLDRATMLCR